MVRLERRSIGRANEREYMRCHDKQGVAGGDGRETARFLG
jgi:hypothetical protein